MTDAAWVFAVIAAFLLGASPIIVLIIVTVLLGKESHNDKERL